MSGPKQRAPTMINGHEVFLYAELERPKPNAEGEPATCAYAVVGDVGGEVFQLLELDASGEFIPPYDWFMGSLEEARSEFDVDWQEVP